MDRKEELQILGEKYENGEDGFPQDYEKAFNLYAQGGELGNYSCYDSMARMILDEGTAPEGYDKAFGYDCAWKALKLDSEEALEVVVRGYKNGFLSEHAEEIENIYIPLYEQEIAEEYAEYDYDDEYQGGYEVEYEVEEDDWGMDPDIDLSFQTCSECADGIVSRAQNREKEWEIADIVRKFIATAEGIKDDDYMMVRLYGLSTQIEDYIFDHPRLKVSFMEFQLELVRAIEAHGTDIQGVDRYIAEDIETLRQSIALADEGRLAEIPQTGHLRKDPVEWTKEWEEHIDEADKIAYSRLEGVPRGMGFCFSFWPERRSALRKFGIDWKDPHRMNPRVMFD